MGRGMLRSREEVLVCCVTAPVSCQLWCRQLYSFSRSTSEAHLGAIGSMSCVVASRLQCEHAKTTDNKRHTTFVFNGLNGAAPKGLRDAN